MVPTLRDIDILAESGFVKADSHKGDFKSLKGIVNFYLTRVVKPPCVDQITTEKDALAELAIALSFFF